MKILNEYEIVKSISDSQLPQLIDLFHKMHWPKSIDELKIILENSLSFGLIKRDIGDLVGYARMLTDKVKYAFIFDLILEEQYQKKGLGRTLIEAILACPELEKVKNFELTCAPEKMGFYEKFGFSNRFISDEFGEVVPMRLKRLPAF